MRGADGDYIDTWYWKSRVCDIFRITSTSSWWCFRLLKLPRLEELTDLTWRSILISSFAPRDRSNFHTESWTETNVSSLFDTEITSLGHSRSAHLEDSYLIDIRTRSLFIPSSWSSPYLRFELSGGCCSKRDNSIIEQERSGKTGQNGVYEQAEYVTAFCSHPRYQKLTEIRWVNKDSFIDEGNYEAPELYSKSNEYRFKQWWSLTLQAATSGSDNMGVITKFKEHMNKRAAEKADRKVFAHYMVRYYVLTTAYSLATNSFPSIYRSD